MRHLGFLFRSGFTLGLFLLASAVSAQRITGRVENSGANLPAAVAASAPAESKPSLDALFDALASVRHFQKVVISPDGKQVAWVESTPNNKNLPSGKTAIYVSAIPTSSAAPRRITAATDGKDYSEDDVSWSPDSKQLAFLSDANASDRPQVYVVDVAPGGNARQLTSLTGAIADPQWSPNGKLIAVLFTENAPRAADPLAPVPPELGVIEQTIHEQRVTTVDVASKQVRQLSPADIHVYEYDWSPDGKTFAVTAAKGVADDEWYLAKLYTVSLDSGEMKLIYTPPLQLAVPRWSPDGKSVAFVAGLMSDEGCVGGDIFVVPAAGGDARNVTPGIKSQPGWLQWLSPEKIIFAENFDGSGRVSTVDVTATKPETLWTAPEVVHATGLGSYSLSLSADHQSSAVIRQSFSSPPEIWVGPIGAWKQVTHLNSKLQMSWGKVEDLRWTNEGMAG